MRKTIGFVELNSIARGIEVADCMLKAAEVKLIFAKPVCPGKYIILISGDVGAVKSSVEDGVKLGKHFIVDKLVIANVHEQLIPAINGALMISDIKAIGSIEYFNISTAIVGADLAAKAADIKLIEVRLGIGIGGKAYVVLCGDVSSVESGVKAAIYDAELNGNVVSHCIIPSPTPELFYSLL